MSAFMHIKRLFRNWFGGSKGSASVKQRPRPMVLECLEDRMTPATINVLVPAYFYPEPSTEYPTTYGARTSSLLQQRLRPSRRS